MIFGLRVFALPGGQVCTLAVEHKFWMDLITAEVPRGTTGLMVESRAGRTVMAIEPNLAPLFAGRPRSRTGPPRPAQTVDAAEAGLFYWGLPVDGFEALSREQRSLKAFYTAGQTAPTCGCQLIINLQFGIGCLGSTLFRGGRALQAFGDAIAKVLEHPTFPRLKSRATLPGSTGSAPISHDDA